MGGLRSSLLALIHDMATVDDYTNLKNGSTQGAEAIDYLLSFAGAKATGGAHRASILQLPVVMTRTMLDSFVMTYGVKAAPDEDPIHELRDKLELRGKYAQVVLEPVIKDTRTVEAIGVSASELEELVALRAEKQVRDAQKEKQIANAKLGRERNAMLRKSNNV